MELRDGDGSEESKVQSVEQLLRSTLPDYIVNCLLVAGFDTLDVLARIWMLEANRAIPLK